MSNFKTITLEIEYLEMVKDILRKNLASMGVKAYIFGSRVQSRAKPTSDIDIALEAENAQKLDYFKVISPLKEAFEESRIKYSVDVIDLNAIEESFKKHIISDLVEVAYN
jgi:predicted nucleotidyltransferase